MPTQSLSIKNSLLNWNCFSQRPIDINIYYLIIILIISQTVRLGIRQRRKWCISQKSLFIPCTWCCFTWGVVSVMWAAVFSTAKKKKNLTSNRQKMEGKKYFATWLSLKTSCSSRCHNMYGSKFQFKKYKVKNLSLTLASYQWMAGQLE